MGSFLDNFVFCVGGGSCCLPSIRVCFLCLLRTLCGEEDVSVCGDGNLHTSGERTPNTFMVLLEAVNMTFSPKILGPLDLSYFRLLCLLFSDLSVWILFVLFGSLAP